MAKENIEKTIWASLKAHDLPDTAAAAVMGNLCAESALRPDNMEDQYQKRLGMTDQSYTAAVDSGTYTNFVHDAVGYGLAQWTWHSRKLGLLTAAKRQGVSIGDPDLQMEFLFRELETQWPSLLRSLRDPAVTLYDATARFMKGFENPADQSDAAVAGRVQLAQIYYNRYHR